MTNETASYWFRIQGLHKDSDTAGDGVSITSSRGGSDKDQHAVATIDYLFSRSGPWS